MTHQTVRISYRPPYDWAAALAFLQRRALEGVEAVAGGVYRRTIRTGDGAGRLAVTPDEAGMALVVDVAMTGGDIATVVERLTRLFDLAADPQVITAGLSRDPWMAALAAARPAMRVFGGWDPFEVAMRSIIGQQVSVTRARHLNGVLVDRCGAALEGPSVDGLRRLFPGPREVLDADLSSMGMPGARAVTLKTVAAAALDDPRLFTREGSLDATIAKLRALKGIGDWTAHYIAMRACREPDAFPASDIGLLRGAAGAGGQRPTAAALLVRAERWRPWRAYAAHHLWAADPSFATPEAANSTARDGVPAAGPPAIVGA